jgi:hypothetical protein
MNSINKFGRLPAPQDARDLRFRLRSAMPQINAAAGKPTPRKRAYRDGPLLDQGPHPHCCGYAARGLLDGAPIMSKPSEEPTAVGIYREAQKRDEWAGEAYEGTSVRATVKYLAEVGAISSYAWGQDIDEAIAWMNGGYGTCLVGTDWFVEMSEVDANGFMREPATSLATPIGGHAWRLIWYDAKRKGLLMRNSWGHNFGWPLARQPGLLSGYAYVRVEFMRWLLARWGEIAAPTQVKIKPGAL